MSPIPLRELKARAGKAKGPREGTLGDRVLAKLRKGPDQAWRASELARALKTDVHIVGSALRRLRQRGLVDKLDEHWFALDDRAIAQHQAMVLTTRLANEKWGPEDPRDWPPG